MKSKLRCSMHTTLTPYPLSHIRLWAIYSGKQCGRISAECTAFQSVYKVSMATVCALTDVCVPQICHQVVALSSRGRCPMTFQYQRRSLPYTSLLISSASARTSLTIAPCLRRTVCLSRPLRHIQLATASITFPLVSGLGASQSSQSHKQTRSMG